MDIAPESLQPVEQERKEEEPKKEGKEEEGKVVVLREASSNATDKDEGGMKELQQFFLYGREGKERETKLCEFCQEVIAAKATRCRYCGSALSKKSTEENESFSVVREELQEQAIYCHLLLFFIFCRHLVETSKDTPESLLLLKMNS